MLRNQLELLGMVLPKKMKKEPDYVVIECRYMYVSAFRSILDGRRGRGIQFF
jgi:hypothetical protein